MTSYPPAARGAATTDHKVTFDDDDDDEDSGDAQHLFDVGCHRATGSLRTQFVRLFIAHAHLTRKYEAAARERTAHVTQWERLSREVATSKQLIADDAAA